MNPSLKLKQPRSQLKHVRKLSANIAKMAFRLFILTTFVVLATAQLLEPCIQYCSAQISLLEECSLPPLTETYELRPWKTLDDGTEVRRFESRAEANCYCTEGRLDRQCSSCFTDQWMDDNTLRETDEFRNWDDYQDDCRRLGFYDDDVVGYPSTTRSALPTSTPGARVCSAECGILRGAIQQCKLTPLEKSPTPSRERLTLNYYATVLHNRTAGECTCTIPVLEAMPGCLSCLRENAGQAMIYMGAAYADDCENLGYRVVVEVEDVADAPTTTSDAPAEETSQADNGGERTGPMLMGVMGLVVFIGFFLNW